MTFDALTQDMFDARMERWWPDVVSGLRHVYPVDVADEAAERLRPIVAAGFENRDEELRRLDYRAELRPDRLQAPAIIGYAAYADRFAGSIAGVHDRLDYLQELGVTYLHLLPLLATRLGVDDGGYAVVDYGAVRPDLGTMDDVRTLTAALRARGMSLVLDLVLNHVAAEHDWARRARAGDRRYRAYFHVFEDRALPDAYEESLPEMFPDWAPGNFTWDQEVAGWVWTTFNAWQWDVNWSNPDVLIEYARIILDLANAGVEVLRLDALAFLWKRMGTDGQGQPEVHSITQVLRAMTRIVCPAVSFQAEATVAPQELGAYLGQRQWSGTVSDLADHNSLMVQIWSSLATKDARLAARALAALPPIPSSAAWITYLRCHDDIEWAISDSDAARVGWSGPDHRRFLTDWYLGNFYGSQARGRVFQENPTSGDRRVSGTAAALIGVEAAEGTGGGRADAAASELLALRLAHAIVFGWGGIPVIWSGDELATPNDPDWWADPAHADDNRWAHRPALDEGRRSLRHRPWTVPGRAFADLAAIARTRARLPYLHAGVTSEVETPYDPGVLSLVRRHSLGTMLQLYNVTLDWRPYPGSRLGSLGLSDTVDALTGHIVTPGADGKLWLPPYAAWWLVPADGPR